jgi:predicted nucleotidyltransferase
MEQIDSLLEVIKSTEEFDRVEFIIFHGSMAKDRGMKTSDYDICIYYDGDNREMSKFRLELLSKLPGSVDVQIFQQLPLYVKKEVLKGRVLYTKRKGFLDEIAIETIKDFESFRPRFYDYINNRSL